MFSCYPRWPSIYLIAITLGFPLVSQAEQLIQFAESPWPPFVVAEANNTTGAEGSAVDLVKRIFSRIDGVEAEFEMLPWKRVLSELKNGNKDAISFLQYTAERAEFLDFTDPVYSSVSVFYYSKKKYPNGIQWRTLEDLSGYRIGVVSDYASTSRLNRAIASGIDLDVQKVVGSDHQLFQMLEKRRIDLFVANIDVGNEIIQKNGWQKEIGLVKQPIQSVEFHLAFSKKQNHHKLIDRINLILAQLKSEDLILLHNYSSSPQIH